MVTECGNALLFLSQGAGFGEPTEESFDENLDTSSVGVERSSRDAGKHRHDVCVDVARTADLLILVLDWRYGAAFVGSPEISVSWAEFRAARDAGVPVFAYVRRAIFNEQLTWKKNPGITPAHCRNAKTFELLDELPGSPACC